MKTRFALVALVTLMSASVAGAQSLNSNIEQDGKRPASRSLSAAVPDGRKAYPKCDADFRQSCKDNGGTMSGKQGWGGMTCWTSLSDSYCKN